MSRFGVCVFVLLVYVVTHIRCQGSPGCKTTLKEGSSTFFECFSVTVKSTIEWKVERNGSLISVSSCGTDGSCNNWMTGSYIGELMRNSSGSYTRYSNRLTILQANRSDTTFQCFVDDVKAGDDCELEIFVPPEKPTCDVLKLDTSMTKINITCRTRRVYPDAVLSISYNGAGLSATIPVERTCNKTASPISPGDSMVECVVLFPLKGAVPGTLSIYPQMIPRISDFDEALQQGVDSDFLDPVVLKSPKAKISNCPMGSHVRNNYIMSGSVANCTCQLEELGYPSGQARWYTDNGKIVGTETASDMSSSLVLSYNPSDPSPTFKCGASTLLNTTVPSLSYSPEFAYGPSSVTTEDQSFDLCPVSQSVAISCKVPFNLVNPSVNFTILVNNDILVNQSQGSLPADFYEYVQNYRPTKGGALPITCRATNSLFPELVSEKVSYLRVREPPTSAPVIWSNSQTNETNIILTEGEDAAIFCRVDGGVPPVNDIKLTCGSFSNEEQNRIVTLSLKATKSLNGLICSCTASHVTGCYDKSSHITINVQADEPSKIGIIAGSVVGGIVVLGVVAGIVILFLLYHRRLRERSRTNYNRNTESRIYTNPYIIPDTNMSPPRLHRVNGTSKTHESTVYDVPYTSSPPYNSPLGGDYLEPADGRFNTFRG